MLYLNSIARYLAMGLAIELAMAGDSIARILAIHRQYDKKRMGPLRPRSIATARAASAMPPPAPLPQRSALTDASGTFNQGGGNPTVC